MKSPRKRRSGVHVETPTPAMFRWLVRLVPNSIATRADDGSFTILDEQRWSEVLAACNGKEIP